MKIKCPKCSSVAKVDLSRIPDKGGVAKCPQCKERIYLQRDGTTGAPPPKKDSGPDSEAQSTSETGGKESRSSSRRLGRRPTSQKPSQAPPPEKKRPPRLLRELDPEVQDEAPEWDPEWEPPVTIGVEHTGVQLRGWFTAFVFIVCLTAGFLIFRGLYIQDVDEMDKFLTAQPRPGVKYEPEYTVDDYSRDLRRIRRRVVRSNYSTYTMEQLGFEFRVMYDVLSECGGECNYINKVRIVPLDTKNGFEALIDCYEDGKYTVKYMWFSKELSVNNRACR